MSADPSRVPLVSTETEALNRYRRELQAWLRTQPPSRNEAALVRQLNAFRSASELRLR